MGQRILYYDVFCGISGDMHLGALLDLGVPMDYIRQVLEALPLRGQYRLDASKAEKMGITGTKAKVWLASGRYDLPEEAAAYHDHEHRHDLSHHHAHHHAHHHDQHHEHDHEHHHHEHQHEHDHEHHHHHRAYADIKSMLEVSSLPERIKARSLAVFAELAVAEAGVHGKSIDAVHFHEVGSVDAIVDIVSAAAALEYLGVDRVMASPVHVGGGMVRCAHGVFPVPAPATAAILKSVPLVFGRVNSETTTPTGAAILKAFVEEFTETPRLTIEKIGYGLGTKDFDIPNVLRVYLGETQLHAQAQGNPLEGFNTPSSVEQVREFVMETNIDDMSPEHFPALEGLLFESGAKDVWKTAIVMKKQRLATQLSVLCPQSALEAIETIIFRHSTAAGLRIYPVDKRMLERRWVTVETTYGAVAVKQLIWQGEVIKEKPEYEDCARLAKAAGVSVQEVARAASAQ